MGHTKIKATIQWTPTIGDAYIILVKGEIG